MKVLLVLSSLTGVISEESFSFDIHIQSCINKAHKMRGIIERTLSFLDKDIFKKPVQSPSSVSSGVWQCNVVSRFEKTVSHN